MRKINQEIKDLQIIEDILSSSIICRIAMIDGERPYLLPFNYGYKDNCIYIHSALEGKKLDVLRLTAGIRIYPDTQLAKTAENQGLISSESNLLYPHYYLSKEVEKWLYKRLKEWRASRPYVIM